MSVVSVKSSLVELFSELNAIHMFNDSERKKEEQRQVAVLM